MPTFQTSPMYPVIYADQAYAMNSHGIGKLKPVHIPSFQGWGVQSSPHSEWKNDADKKVRNQLQTNKLKESGMVGKRNTTERSQRYERPASRSAVPNGVFPGHEYLTSTGRRGGVITSPEGREWLRKRLHNRIVEYDAIANGDFSQGPPPAIDMNPKFNALDALFQQVFDQFSTGLFSSGLIDTMSRLLNAYLDAGSTFESNELGPYAESIQKLTEAIRSYTGQAGEGLFGPRTSQEETRRVISFVRRTLVNMSNITEEIARTIYMTIPQRKSIMDGLRSKFLKKTAREFTPSFVPPSVQRNIESVPGVELGAPSQPPLRPSEQPRSAEDEESADLEARFPAFAPPPPPALSAPPARALPTVFTRAPPPLSPVPALSSPPSGSGRYSVRF